MTNKHLALLNYIHLLALEQNSVKPSSIYGSASIIIHEILCDDWNNSLIRAEQYVSFVCGMSKIPSWLSIERYTK